MAIIARGKKNAVEPEKTENSKTYKRLSLSENSFFFDSKTDRTFNLNRNGAVVLRGLIDGVTPKDLCASLVEQFGVDKDVAARDLDQFILRLREFSLDGNAKPDRG